LEEIINLSVEKYGENEKRARYVYENSYNIVSLFEELDIKYERRSFWGNPS
jgi:hypothetical protein